MFPFVSVNVTVFLLASWLAGDMGWRMAFRISPLLMAIVSIVFYFSTKDYPWQVGIELPGETNKIKHGGHARRYMTALKNSSFILACFSLGFHHVTRWGLIGFLPKFFADTAGWNVKKAGMMAAILPLGMAAGALSGGYISDKVFHGRRKQAIFFSVLLCTLCIITISYIVSDLDTTQLLPEGLGERQEVTATNTQQSPTVLTAFKKFYLVVTLLVSGYFLYVCIGPYFALCPDLLGVECAGTGIGIMDAIAYGFAAAGTATVGILIDHYGYSSAFWLMSICAVLGAILIRFVKE